MIRRLFPRTSFGWQTTAMRYSTQPFASAPRPIPLGDKQQQKEMEELINRGGLSDDQLDLVAKGENVMHPDAPKETLQSFPENVNPETGEVGGPKGPDPVRYGDWERKGRVFDF